jgi:hypothetical protein
MKQRTIFSHISIPAIFAVGVFIYALGRESFSLEMLASVLIGGFLFYAAPHLLWAVVVAIGKPSNVVAHSGFIASTLALVLIASLWLFPPDPSGLPMQWMLYWPLAIILLIFVAGGTAAYVRTKAPNKAPQPTRYLPQ